MIWNDSNEEDGKSMKKEGRIEEYQKDEEYNSLIESATMTWSMVYGIEFELYKGLPIKQTPNQILSAYQMWSMVIGFLHDFKVGPTPCYIIILLKWVVKYSLVKRLNLQPVGYYFWLHWFWCFVWIGYFPNVL